MEASDFTPERPSGPSTSRQYIDSPSEWQSSPSTPPLSPEFTGQAGFRESAKLKLMRVAMQLPYGGSTFFHAISVDVPQSLLPSHVVIGVNKKGVHFFSPQPQRYLHSFSLSEVLSAGCYQQQQQLLLKVWVAGGVDVFRFQTASARQISQALVAHKLAKEAKQHRGIKKQNNGKASLQSSQSLDDSQPVQQSSQSLQQSSQPPPAPAAQWTQQRSHVVVDDSEEDEEEDCDLVRPFHEPSELPRWHSAPPQQQQSPRDNHSLTASPKTPQTTHFNTSREAKSEAVSEAESDSEATPVYLPAPRHPEDVSSSPADSANEMSGSVRGTPPKPSGRQLEADYRRALFRKVGDVTTEQQEGHGRSNNAAAAGDEDFNPSADSVAGQIHRLEAKLNASQLAVAATSQPQQDGGEEEPLAVDEAGDNSSVSIDFAAAEGAQLPDEVMMARLRELDDENQELAEANSSFEEERRAYLSDLAGEHEKVVLLEQEVARLQTLLAAGWEERQRQEADAAGQLQTVRKLYRDESLQRRKYHNALEELKGRVRVCVRIRPLLPALDACPSPSESPTAEVVTAADDLTVAYPWKGDPQRQFSFDSVLGSDASQEAAFEKASPLVQNAIDGYNACVVAYGQTASGKTHTIFGTRDAPGLLPRAAHQLFEAIAKDGGKGTTYRVRCTLVEVYLNELHDLFTMDDERPPTPRMDIKRDPQGVVWVQGATMVEVATAEELTLSVTCGEERRRKTAMKAGRDSSRSHSVFSALVESTNVHTGVKTVGKLTFVDLAGSESVQRTGAEGEELREAIAINKSLAALGDVVSALVSGDAHVPYNNHKLTKLLSDGLGGNAKTLMIITVSPAAADLEESHSSLQFASRVRAIKNAAKKNQADKEIQALRAEVKYWRERAVLLPDSRDALDLRDIQNDRTVDGLACIDEMY